MATLPTTAQLSKAQTGSTAIAQIAGAANALGGLIFATPINNTVGYQPLNPRNSNGLPSILPTSTALVFNYEGEQTASFESDITDHYVEDNSAVQDQIAIKPEIITTRGFVGELNDVLPPLLQPLQKLANTLITIDAYTPQLSATALIKYNEAVFAYQNAASILNSAVQAWSSISSLFGNNTGEVVSGTGVFTSGTPTSQNKQQVMFQQLYGYWYTRTLFNIQTPWAIFSNMAILNVKSVQDEDTRMITDFQVTFKKIRVASTLLTTSSILGGRAEAQSASLTNQGTSSGGSSSSLGPNILAA